MPATRTERDSMGPMDVPADALYGASTQRAVLNFPISGYRFGRHFIRALGLVKLGAAEANQQLGKLDEPMAVAIQKAAREVADGQHDAHFVVDVFQTGSGTSTNMNANEVIGTLATRILQSGAQGPRVHPNDHVNMGQSSNDVIPTAMHLAIVDALREDLLPSVRTLQAALQTKGEQFEQVVKIGRTHLMDATPIRLGQEFRGYAGQMAQAAERAEHAVEGLLELPIGGTAVGTGINTHPKFAALVCEVLTRETGVAFCEAGNHFEAQHAKDAVVSASGTLRTIAISLNKIANDIRLLGSGPRCGIGELRLPATQPGSSIMPGKVNPVIPEAVLQVCAQVIGNDAATAWAGAMLGTMDLHVGMPVMAQNVLESARLLGRACAVLTERCVVGLEANVERCGELIEQSLAMCTSLAPLVGYDQAAAIAKQAFESGQTVRQVALAKGLLSAAQLDAALDPGSMTEPRA